ncbi:hypothetical protein DPMN_000367 [Dreissena polymorpha]|uniref:Uncharacterized protein n=1 Tax=Dreissena polymorpha TaxID=45954 RepID=A0A9D4MJL0_DREPO|nr:hypothetical protein DPMN_000367 [Dreissena polymorpha]
MCEEISCLYVTRQTSEQIQVVTGSALRNAGTGNPRIIDAATHQLRHNTVTVDIAQRMRPEHRKTATHRLRHSTVTVDIATRMRPEHRKRIPQPRTRTERRRPRPPS